MAGANTNEHYREKRKNRTRVTVKKKIYHIQYGREVKHELKHVYVGPVNCEEKIHHLCYGGSDY